MVELRAGPQASRLRVLKYLPIHIRFALIDLTQGGTPAVPPACIEISAHSYQICVNRINAGVGRLRSRQLVLKYLPTHIRFALIDLTQAGRLRSRSYFDSVISDNLPKNETDNFPRLIFSLTKATFDLKF